MRTFRFSPALDKARPIHYSAIPGLLLGCAFWLVPAVQAQGNPDETADPVDLRERLTEREDEERLQDPWTLDIGGRPLFVSGQYEVSWDYLDERVLSESEAPYDSLHLEQGFEAELFYSTGSMLSMFAQLRIATEHDLHSSTPNGVASTYLERGEMWLYAEDVAGSGIDFEVGRLDFEDDRLWWWDEDLDAMRMQYGEDEFELAVAVAYELAPRRSDTGFIEPDDNEVLRYIAEGSWDWAPDHSLQFFALINDDRSNANPVGQVVRREQADESDARLTWLGLRASGAVQTRALGIVGYWFDYATVTGDEWLADYDESGPTSVVGDRFKRRVRGWAFDLGGTWILPVYSEPRISLGHAVGSGDRNLDDSTDHGFHQTGLHGNEVGFGGVERFDHYGLLLDPELSNLSVTTIGAGLSLLAASSLDLVYNRYRLRVAADSLRDARIDSDLNGTQRNLGEALDLILAVEEGQRFDLEMTASAFRPGAAYGSNRGNWLYGAFMALRVPF